MAQLTKDTPHNPKMGGGSKGIVQIVVASGTVTLKGSLDGQTYIDIEAGVSTNTLKEIALCPYLKFEATDASSTVHVDETR